MTIALVLVSALLGVAALAWWRERARRRARTRAHAAEMAALKSAHAAELREQAGRWQAVLDSMIEGILVLDGEHRVQFANRAASQLFAFTLPAQDRELLELVRHHEVAALVRRLSHEPAVLRQELRTEETPPRFLEINAVALHDGTGARSGAVLVFHDLTRIRELEGVRQEFVANVSHELRTPLSLIKGATETLLDGAKSDPVALERLLTIVNRHADRLTLLIDDLLLLAKLDSGRVVLESESLPLRLAVQEVVEDLLPRARQRNVALENQLPSGLRAQADPLRLRQVLCNLIDNGIKYGREGGTVRLSARELDAQHVELCVQDDGPGIPEEARARIFERFFRADKARSREQGGTGLGLAIVKHVVQAHGGEVRVESQPGQGTAFYFTLPR